MHWPQITLIVLFTIHLTVVLLNDGKPRGKYSIGSSLLDTAILFALLYCGGFWK
jgi:hypothetical protein